MKTLFVFLFLLILLSCEKQDWYMPCITTVTTKINDTIINEIKLRDSIFNPTWQQAADSAVKGTWIKTITYDDGSVMKIIHQKNCYN